MTVGTPPPGAWSTCADLRAGLRIFAAMRVLAALLLLPSCGVPDPGAVSIIAHGGLGPSSHLPLYGRASLHAALHAGADGVYLPIQLTSDHQLVVFEPYVLDSLTHCKGRVNAHRYAALRQCAFRDPLHDHGFFRLDTLLRELAERHPQATYTLDCKLHAEELWWEYLDRFAEAVAVLDTLPGVEGRIRVVCELDEFLLKVQRLSPGIAITRYATDTESAIWRALTSRWAGIHVSDDRITREQVAFARERGLEVTIFAVGDRKGHRSALRKRPDRVQSSDPRALLP